MMQSKNQQLGITLLELMFAVSIAIIVGGLAVGTLATVRDAIKIRNTVNSLAQAFHLARQTSINTGLTTVICKSIDGHNCNAQAAWHDGWLVFTDREPGSPPARDNNDPVHLVQGALREQRVIANRDAFVLRPTDKRSTNGTLRVCGTGGAAPQAVIVSYTGKPRISNSNANGSALECAAHA